jgi:hypothetical protein
MGGSKPMPSTCRSCGLEIVWKEVYTREGYRFLPYDESTGISHFITCPDRKRWLRTKYSRSMEAKRPQRTLGEFIGRELI